MFRRTLPGEVIEARLAEVASESARTEKLAEGLLVYYAQNGEAIGTEIAERTANPMTGQGSAAVQICSECGAPTVEGVACWEQFGSILAWEWSDPELQARRMTIADVYQAGQAEGAAERVRQWASVIRSQLEIADRDGPGGRAEHGR